MIGWVLIGLALLGYDELRGPSAAAVIGAFFCGANFALADLRRIQAPLLARLRKLTEKGIKP